MPAFTYMGAWESHKQYGNLYGGNVLSQSPTSNGPSNNISGAGWDFFRLSWTLLLVRKCGRGDLHASEMSTFSSSGLRRLLKQAKGPRQG